MTTFKETAKAFQEVQERHAEFGACDTEPRAVFALLIDSVVDAARWGGKVRPVPTTIDGWQIFGREVMDGRTGAGKAAREMAAAARKAVTAARRNPGEAESWLRGW